MAEQIVLSRSNMRAELRAAWHQGCSVHRLRVDSTRRSAPPGSGIIQRCKAMLANDAGRHVVRARFDSACSWRDRSPRLGLFPSIPG